MSDFVKQSDVRQESFDWGTIGWRLTPQSGSKQLVIMDVTLEPGEGHDFHRHPGQEEMIIVKQGEITQYVERDSTTLGVGDSVYLDENVIHASFNDGSETAYLQVVIGPSLGGDTRLDDVVDPGAAAADVLLRGLQSLEPGNRIEHRARRCRHALRVPEVARVLERDAERQRPPLGTRLAQQLRDVDDVCDAVV